jgi:ACS family tartrate transporter-like MFS transporter
VREATGRFDVGFMALAAIVLAAGLLMLAFRAQLGPSLQCNDAAARKI